MRYFRFICQHCNRTTQSEGNHVRQELADIILFEVVCTKCGDTSVVIYKKHDVPEAPILPKGKIDTTKTPAPHRAD